MGFFDRFSSKKPAAANAPAAPAIPGDAAPSPTPPAPASPAASVKSRLAAAREKLEAKDLPAAMAIYEAVLASAGDRADVLVALSGDLGSHGHVAEIVELVAPRYDAERHGPATGLNLLQAYLAVRHADAAQHVLDLLFALNRPELEERLHGFSNAIAELLASPAGPIEPGADAASAPGQAAKIGLVTIGKPIWFYGLEPLAAQILPPKEGRLRRIAFAQMAVPAAGAGAGAVGVKPDDELARLSRAIPLWLAETFYFSASYLPTAAMGLLTTAEGEGRFVGFGAEWTLENLRQLVETTEGGLDYIVTGALGATAGDYELQLRVWEVKTFRERKTFAVRWTPSTADAALAQVQAQLRGYMEWSPASAAFAYTVPTQPRAWLDTLAAAVGLFLVEKKVLSATQLPPVEAEVQAAGGRAAAGEAASLAFLTLRARAVRLALAPPVDAPLARSPLVLEAQKALG